MSTTTDDRHLRGTARDRLFETALAEVVTGDPLAEAPAVSPPPARSPLWAAAALLLGLGVAVSVWWLRQPTADEAWQEPAPIPIATRVGNGAELRRLDRQTVSIRIENAMPQDLAVLPEFPGLRSVSMNPDFTRAGQQAWQAADLATLEPLTRCPALEVLELPFTAKLAAPHLELLGRCAKLRSFEVRGASLRIDAANVGLLAKWPALRHLSLLDPPMTTEGIRALATLPKLRSLDFYRCNGLDDGPFEALAEIDRLQALRITGLGEEPEPKVVVKPRSGWQPNVRQLRGLRALENLRSLTLLGPTWTAERVDALPRGLRRLSISSNQAIPSAAIRSMRRFEQLEHLGFGRIGGTEAERLRTAEDVADLLGALRLQSFDWSQDTPARLARAIGGQPALRKLSLTWPHGLDLAPLGALTELRKVSLAARWRAAGEDGELRTTIVPPAQVLADTLRPLASCRSLQSVTVFAGALDARARAQMRAALPERIALRFY